MYVTFWELSIAYTNGGKWAPFSKVCPTPAQTSNYATGYIKCNRRVSTKNKHKASINHYVQARNQRCKRVIATCYSLNFQKRV